MKHCSRTPPVCLMSSALFKFWQRKAWLMKWGHWGTQDVGCELVAPSLGCELTILCCKLQWVFLNQKLGLYCRLGKSCSWFLLDRSQEVFCYFPPHFRWKWTISGNTDRCLFCIKSQKQYSNTSPSLESKIFC